MLEQFSRSRAVRVAAQPAALPDLPLEPIYLHVDGEEPGPYLPNTLREMIQASTISLTSFYWRNDLQEWRPLSEFDQPQSA